MGPQEDYIETVVTCEGDFHDPQLKDRLRHFQQRLENLLLEDGKKQLILKKVEPWNSVRITFSIPRQAALRLKQLAQQGSATLRQIGVLGVQIQGDRLVSLTVATANNQRAELIISTHEGSEQASAGGSQQSVSVGTSFDPGMPSSSEEQGSPGPNMEVTRKNIEEYLRQGSLFNSIPAPACVPGPSRAGPSHDIMKKPTSADGTAFRVNNIAVDGMPGPSSLPGIPERAVFHGGDCHGPAPMAVQQSVGVPVSGQRGPRMSVAQHSMHQPQRYNIGQQKQLHQQVPQLSAQGTALPQTAAFGYNMMGLPPPPPYPHGHGMAVANNVRPGKKPPASSPLLINLLQTEPVAGSNNVMAAPGTEKKVKKHRRRKEKQASATVTLDGQAGAQQGLPNLALESESFSGGVPPQTMPSQEEMSAVLHRQVSPVPLPSPRLGTGFSNSVPVPADIGSEGFRDKNPTASAALASLAQNQKSTSEPEQVSDNSIINPYTGHMEPRDSASDLSPVKQDQQKPRKSSLTEGLRNETSVSGVSVNTQVSLAAAKEDLKMSSSESVCIGLGSFQPVAAVPSTLREEQPKGYSSSVISSEHSLVSDRVFGQRPDSGHSRVTTESSTLPVSAAPHIYAQHPFGPSQPLPRAPHFAPQHSTHTHTPKAGTSTVNGPIQVTMPPSFPVSGQLSTTESQLQMPRLMLEGGLVDSYHLTSHKARSVHGDIVHNVSLGHEAKSDDTGSLLCGDTSSRQPVTASSAQPLTHKAIPALEMRTSVSTVAVQAQNDSLKLLNSSSVSLGVAQRLAVDSAIPSASTASPAAIKTPSDGEDNNSNHSGISPVSTVAPAPSSLLDANGTKVENHDSGMGSSSERSDDTTPSEAGDGEFQTNVPTTESSATDNSCKKSAVAVKKTMVNCKKEPAGSSDAHTITVGYVQMNQFNTDPYNKESKKNMAEAPLLIGDKSVSVMDETLREVSNLIKSTAGLIPASSQMTLGSHKDVNVSLPLPTKFSSLQYQQVMMKHKAAMNYQVSDIHQNGPTSLPSGVPPSQHLQGQHVPSSLHSGQAHHSSSVPVSHGQNQLGVSRPPASTANKPSSQEPADQVSSSQSYSVWPHQASSTVSSLAQGGLLPSSVHSQIVRTGLHPTSLPSAQPPGLSPHVPACVAGEAVPAALLSSARNSQATGGPSLHNASQMVGSTVGLSKNKGQNIITRDLTNPIPQEVHPAGKPSSSQAQRIVSQGLTSHASNRTPALHAVNVTSGPGQHAAAVGAVGPSAHCSSPSLASHPQGACFQGPSPQVSISQSPTSLAPASNPVTLSPSLHSSGSKLAKTHPSLPSFSSASAVLKTTTAHAFTSAGLQLPSSVGSHPPSSGYNMATSNLLHPVSSEVESRGLGTCTTFSTPQITEGDLVKHPTQNASAANSTLGSVSITGLDLGNVASSDMVSDASLAEFGLLDESSSHVDDVFSAEDLALISEPGLSAYLDVGVRHGATNGNASVSTETRAGVNITSMYTKRSSPVNVNMLNHIYAAGLPQPRRLTESVQRLVKPLPNPENSLLPGRACKSPSASSRHSSNGSPPSTGHASVFCKQPTQSWEHQYFSLFGLILFGIHCSCSFIVCHLIFLLCPVFFSDFDAFTFSSSASDLSSHTTVVTAGHIHPAIAATSSVCSNTLAASKSADFPVTHKLVSMGHSVTANSQQALTVSGSVPQGRTNISTESSTRVSVEVKPEHTGQKSDSVHTPSTDPPSTHRPTEVITSSVKTVLLPPTPASLSQRESGVITTLSDMRSLRPMSQTSTLAGERCAPETVTVAKNLSHGMRLKEVERGEKVDGSASTTPVSQHSLQDSTANPQCGPSENPHSKPPLLQPAPPLTLPALIPSATPPPPPLTPVLLQDSGMKEATSSPNQAPSSSEGEVEATPSSDVQERISTVSPFFLATTDPAAGMEKMEVQEDLVSSHSATDAKRDEDTLKDDTPNYASSNETGESEGLGSEHPSASLSLDESSLQTRRLTRKRKSTNSESDSCGEPAPKLSYLESPAASENTSAGTSKTDSSSDLPPKLHKEGQKSHEVERVDDDKGGNRMEDRLAKREEEEKDENDDKSEMKNASHHERNILDATPEEVAKKMAAAGSKRRVHYTYVLEKVNPGQSYFDTPVLCGRTRSQGTKGGKEGPLASPGAGTTTPPTPSAGPMAGVVTVGTGKEESGETGAAGSKRSTRSLRTKDAGESTQAKKKRSKEHR
ncbi:hypothetical protein ACOMHN_034112 [Nucella lapillus]